MGVYTFCPWSSKTTTTTTRTTCQFCLIKVAFTMECRKRSCPGLQFFHGCTRRRWWWRLSPQPQGATPPLFPSPFAVGGLKALAESMHCSAQRQKTARAGKRGLRVEVHGQVREQPPSQAAGTHSTFPPSSTRKCQPPTGWRSRRPSIEFLTFRLHEQETHEELSPGTLLKFSWEVFHRNECSCAPLKNCVPPADSSFGANGGADRRCSTGLRANFGAKCGTHRRFS